MASKLPSDGAHHTGHPHGRTDEPSPLARSGEAATLEKAERKPTTGQKPSSGRIVRFVLDETDRELPAIITRVYDDDSADLLVFLPHGHANGHTMQRPKVRFSDEERKEPQDSSETPRFPTHTWHWPPRV